jgi:hypothetical protein
MIRWENSTIAGNGYGGVDIFMYDMNGGGAYSAIQFASSDVSTTTVSIGGQGGGAGGYGGTGILNIGGWSAGNFGALTFITNNTNVNDNFAGRIDWINDTGNNGKKSAIYISGQIYDTERKAMGLQFGSNEDSSVNYPSPALWITPERVVAQAYMLVGFGIGGINASSMGFPNGEFMQVLDYHNNNIVNNDGVGAFFGSIESGLGSEVLTNPTFTGSATGWTLGTGWAYNSNDVAKNADGTGTLSQTFTAVAGQRYSLYLDVLAAVSGNTIGTATITITGGTQTVTLTPKLRFGTNSFNYSFTALGTSLTIVVTPTNTSRFRIDKISLKSMSWGGIRTAGNSFIGGNLLVGLGLAANSQLHTLGSFATGYVAKTANYTATISDYTINCTANTFTVTLPTAVGVTGRIYVVKNTGTGVITIATTSSQTIDGATTQTLATQYASYTVQSDGANWIII